MPTIRANDAWIHWEQSGEGPPVVLVHGFGDSTNSLWQGAGWIRALARAGRRVVALDLRGHGRSEKFYTTAAYERDVFADDVSEVMRYSGVRRGDLVGFSMGGEIILRYLLRHGAERVRKAALISVGRTTLRPRPKSTALSVRALQRHDVSDMHPALQSFRKLHEERGNDIAALAALMEAEAIRDPLEPAELARIDVPALFIAGELDQFMGDPRSVVDQFPRARLELVAGADHDAAARDPKTQQLVLDFLQNSHEGGAR